MPPSEEFEHLIRTPEGRRTIEDTRKEHGRFEWAELRAHVLGIVERLVQQVPRAGIQEPLAPERLAAWSRREAVFALDALQHLPSVADAQGGVPDEDARGELESTISDEVMRELLEVVLDQLERRGPASAAVLFDDREIDALTTLLSYHLTLAARTRECLLILVPNQAPGAVPVEWADFLNQPESWIGEFAFAPLLDRVVRTRVEIGRGQLEPREKKFGSRVSRSERNSVLGFVLATRPAPRSRDGELYSNRVGPSQRNAATGVDIALEGGAAGAGATSDVEPELWARADWPTDAVLSVTLELVARQKLEGALAIMWRAFVSERTYVAHALRTLEMFTGLLSLSTKERGERVPAFLMAVEVETASPGRSPSPQVVFEPRIQVVLPPDMLGLARDPWWLAAGCHFAYELHDYTTNTEQAEGRFRRALHFWSHAETARGSSPYAIADRFLDYLTAIEVALSSDRNAVTATLAMRVAGIVASDADGRVTTAKQMRRLYGVRSRYVHEGLAQVTRAQLGEARELARLVLRDLASWTVQPATDDRLHAEYLKHCDLRAVGG